jgi:hypothetical protein
MLRQNADLTAIFEKIANLCGIERTNTLAYIFTSNYRLAMNFRMRWRQNDQQLQLQV